MTECPDSLVYQALGLFTSHAFLHQAALCAFVSVVFTAWVWLLLEWLTEKR